MTLELLQEVFADYTEIHPSMIQPASTLREDLGLDSLDLAAIEVELCNRFKKEVNLSNCKTILDILCL